MKLLVGLGNPDSHYDGTRHNVGFAIIDAVANAHGLTWQVKDKFKAAIAEGVIDGQKTILAKPHTYYNLSGEAVLAIKQFYKIENNDVVVIHDELALPFGTLRTRIGGSDAGNNGLKSIIATVGADVARIRIGIANEFTSKQDAADFVLGRFTADEQQQMPDIKKPQTYKCFDAGRRGEPCRSRAAQTQLSSPCCCGGLSAMVGLKRRATTHPKILTTVRRTRNPHMARRTAGCHPT
jgi:PTH1 family peptidyl-tRNA hydrolase